MMKLNVGQVIFILLREDHRLVPVQVVEEVVHRKITGEEVKYYVRASPAPGAKVVPLDFSKETVFLYLENAREYMIENATRAIDAICEEASKACNGFEQAHPHPQPLALVESGEARGKTPPAKQQNAQRVQLDTGEWVSVQM